MSRALTFTVLLSVGNILWGGPVVLDFEGFDDGTILDSQYAGVTLTNAIILSAGISLDEFEFPPHSGTNVVSDDGGPMGIVFGTPVFSFGGYFTYAEALTVSAFNSLDVQVAVATSAFSNNEALSGDPGSQPNEPLQVSFSGGISSVMITGDPQGGSFALDDVTYSSSGTTATPEPGNGALSLFTGAMLAYLRRRFW